MANIQFRHALEEVLERDLLDEEELVTLIKELGEQYVRLENRYTRQREASINSLLLQLRTELSEFTDYPFTLEELEEAHSELSTEICTAEYNRDSNFQEHWQSE